MPTRCFGCGVEWEKFGTLREFIRGLEALTVPMTGDMLLLYHWILEASISGEKDKYLVAFTAEPRTNHVYL